MSNSNRREFIRRAGIGVAGLSALNIAPLARSTAAVGKPRVYHCSFLVRRPPRRRKASFLFVCATNTWRAYSGTPAALLGTPRRWARLQRQRDWFWIGPALGLALGNRRAKRFAPFGVQRPRAG